MRIHVPAWAKRRPTKGLAVIIAVSVAVVALLGGGTYALFFAGSPQPNDSSSVNLQKGLVSHWKFDGNVKDSTPYANNGTIQGGVTPATDRNGKANSAYNFDGSTGYISTTNKAEIGHNFSLSAWFKTSATATNGTLIGYGSTPTGDAPNSDDVLTLTANGNVKFVTDYWNKDVISPNSYNDGTWHQAVATLSDDGSNNIDISLYVDGALVDSNSFRAGLQYFQGYWRIGQLDDNFTGSMDDVRVYDRVINANEAKALYNGAGSDAKIGNLQKGLVGYWKFDGNMKDSSPYGSNCSIGAPYELSYVDDRKGQANSALDNTDQFGDSRSIDCGNASVLSSGQQLTVSAWVYNTAFQTGSQYVGNGIFGDDSYQFFFDQNKHLSVGLQINGGGYDYFASTQTFNINQWYHVTATYDGSTVRLYSGGSQIYSTSFTNYSPASGEAYIGSWLGQSSGRTFEGYLDDVRVYNRALSADEVSQLYDSYNSQINLGGSGSANSTNSVNLTKGLVGYWPFNGNAKDATPYGDNGIVNGAVLTTDRFGKASSAYNFVKTNTNYIADSANSSSSLTMGTQDWTVSAWIKPTALSGSQGIAGTYCTGVTGYWYLMLSGNRLYMKIQDSSGSSKDAISSVSTTVPDTSWHHVAVTVSRSGSAIFYIDGVAAGGGDISSLSGHDISAAATEFNIGDLGSHLSGYLFDGSIDDVRVYNRALSAAEVSALYHLSD